MSYTYVLKKELINLGFKSLSHREGTYKIEHDGIVYIAYWGSYKTSQLFFERVCIYNPDTDVMSKGVGDSGKLKELFINFKKEVKRKINLEKIFKE